MLMRIIIQKQIKKVYHYACSYDLDGRKVSNFFQKVEKLLETDCKCTVCYSVICITVGLYWLPILLYSGFKY